jgi:hypothetical protein
MKSVLAAFRSVQRLAATAGCDAETGWKMLRDLDIQQLPECCT